MQQPSSWRLLRVICKSAVSPLLETNHQNAQTGEGRRLGNSMRSVILPVVSEVPVQKRAASASQEHVL